MNIEQIAYEEASGEMLDYFSKEQLAGYLERCLSKLVGQAGEPSAVDVMCDACGGSGYDKKDSNYGCAECNSSGFVQRRRYTEAQLLAAQQKAAEACAKVCESNHDKACYDQGNYPDGYDLSKAIRRGDWREYL